MEKPFSQACENNKQAILAVIRTYFETGTILEIGSGTGQHAVYFADKLPNVFWQTSDQDMYHAGINLWLKDYQNNNLGSPLSLDVNQDTWPIAEVSGIYSANTAHIMDWSSVCRMFYKNSQILKPGDYFCLYGPVNIDGQYTSESNHSFDLQLRQRDSGMGIRNLEDLQALASENQLEFVTKHAMPANNYTMVWRRTHS